MVIRNQEHVVKGIKKEKNQDNLYLVRAPEKLDQVHNLSNWMSEKNLLKGIESQEVESNFELVEL